MGTTFRTLVHFMALDLLHRNLHLVSTANHFVDRFVALQSFSDIQALNGNAHLQSFQYRTLAFNIFSHEQAFQTK